MPAESKGQSMPSHTPLTRAVWAIVGKDLRAEVRTLRRRLQAAAAPLEALSAVDEAAAAE